MLVAAVLLLAGFFCRAAAVTCWLLHLCAAKSGMLVSYGVDHLMTVGLFYLMLSPLPDRLALDARLSAPPAKRQSIFRFLPPPAAAASLHHLLLRRSDQSARERVVERRKHLAGVNAAPV